MLEPEVVSHLKNKYPDSDLYMLQPKEGEGQIFVCRAPTREAHMRLMGSAKRTGKSASLDAATRGRFVQEHTVWPEGAILSGLCESLGGLESTLENFLNDLAGGLCEISKEPEQDNSGVVVLLLNLKHTSDEDFTTKKIRLCPMNRFTYRVFQDYISKSEFAKAGDLIVTGAVLEDSREDVKTALNEYPSVMFQLIEHVAEISTVKGEYVAKKL